MTLDIKCKKCQTEFSSPIEPDFTSVFLPEFNEFTNVVAVCPNCSTMEIFNMNIPEDEMAEHEFEVDMPFEEINQRYYVRQLIRTVREDFKGATLAKQIKQSR
jgi:hypothetical protein